MRAILGAMSMAGMGRPGCCIAMRRPGRHQRGRSTLRRTDCKQSTPISRSFAPVKRLVAPGLPQTRNCVHVASVQFYADGPSDPYSVERRRQRSGGCAHGSRSEFCSAMAAILIQIRMKSSKGYSEGHPIEGNLSVTSKHAVVQFSENKLASKWDFVEGQWQQMAQPTPSAKHRFLALRARSQADLEGKQRVEAV